ncbi:hypothetical protein BJX66DRAFT_32373 [Aspergillus keveii]|uniref:Uncharacterized protein n=1 Tax=Aspergillus keveii TaxID=714993 RepID=A0ABR4FT04_9EURO
MVRPKVSVITPSQRISAIDLEICSCSFGCRLSLPICSPSQAMSSMWRISLLHAGYKSKEPMRRIVCRQLDGYRIGRAGIGGTSMGFFWCISSSFIQGIPVVIEHDSITKVEISSKLRVSCIIVRLCHGHGLQPQIFCSSPSLVHCCEVGD